MPRDIPQHLVRVVRDAALAAGGEYVETGQGIAGGGGKVNFVKPLLDSYPAYQLPLAGTQNDFPSRDTSWFRLAAAAAATLTGFDGGYGGRLALVSNVGVAAITIANESALSQPYNRVTVSTGHDLVLAPQGECRLVYDDVTARWRVVASSAPGSGPGCAPILRINRDTRCIAGALEVWAQAETTQLINGCEQDFLGPFQFDHAAGCCDCPPPISPPPPPPPSGSPPPPPPPPPPVLPPGGVTIISIYLNQFGELVVIGADGSQTIFCPCGSGSGTGSGHGSGDGNCLAGVCSSCNCPPGAFLITAAGFTAQCKCFNGKFIVTQAVPAYDCSWTFAGQCNGLDMTVSLLIGGGVANVIFQETNGSGIVASASYSAPISANCCTPITLTSGNCACGTSSGGGGGASCVYCTGKTPATITVTVNPGDFTGCFAPFGGAGNAVPGTWVLTYDGNCNWSTPIGNLGAVSWVINDQGSGAEGILTFYLKSLPPASPIILQYDAFYATNQIDCCTPATASIALVVPNNCGTHPAIVTVVPNCPDGPLCPGTITLAPLCCPCDANPSGSGSGGGVSIGCCETTTLPTTLHATIYSGGGTCACLVGTYTLVYTTSFVVAEDEANEGWEYVGTLCGHTIALHFICPRAAADDCTHLAFRVYVDGVNVFNFDPNPFAGGGCDCGPPLSWRLAPNFFTTVSCPDGSGNFELGVTIGP